MRITIKDGNRYYFSCGLTVGESVSPASITALRRRGALTEISHDEWNHSGCQSGCTRRGDRECGW